MKKIEKASELLWLFGVVFVALGVAICSKADLGVSMVAAPAFVIGEALAASGIDISIGMTEYIIQGILILLVCLVIRKFKWSYLLTFTVAVLHGCFLDLFLFLLRDVTVSFVWQRWLMLLVGDACVAFGVASFFRTYMPVEVYEFFVSALSKRYGLGLGRTKWAFDLSLLAISLVLAISLFGDLLTFDFSTVTHASFHSIGLGTLLTTTINTPLITLMGKLVDRFFGNEARFPRLKALIGE